MTMRDLDRALHIAAKRANADAVRRLLALGASVDAQDGFRRTPLMLAAGVGCALSVNYLLEAHAGVLCYDAHRQTALHHAARHGRVDIIHGLVARGAALDVQNEDGLTPIMTAAVVGETTAVRCLAGLGARTAGIERWLDAEDCRSLAALSESGRLKHASGHADMLEDDRSMGL